MSDSYYAMVDAKRTYQKQNPQGPAWDLLGTDVQDKYVDPEMEKRGYRKSRYIGAGAWEWSKL